MKKLCFCLLLIGLLAGCSKDGEESKQPLINRFTVDGKVAAKFLYNNDNQIVKWELYSTHLAGAPLGAVIEFEYEDGKLSTLRTFSFPGNIPGTRVLFEYDNSGRILRHESYNLQGPNPSEPFYYGTYTYAASGRLGNVMIKDEDDELVTSYNFSYYDNGIIKERNAYEETITNQLRLKEKVIYSLPDVNAIKGWEPLSVIPLDGDEIMRRVRYEAHQRFAYNNGVLMSNTSELNSNREYNPDGTLKRQTVTAKKLLPAAPDLESNWEFEYIQQ